MYEAQSDHTSERRIPEGWFGAIRLYESSEGPPRILLIGESHHFSGNIRGDDAGRKLTEHTTKNAGATREIKDLLMLRQVTFPEGFCDTPEFSPGCKASPREIAGMMAFVILCPASVLIK